MVRPFNIVPEQRKQRMNPQPDQDLEHRLQKLEAELNSPPKSPPAIPQPQKPIQPQTDNYQNLQSTLNRFINWFSGLSGFGKLIIIGVAAIVGLAILRAVVKLVAAVISLAILGLLLYLVYQFFIARRSETKD